MTVELEKMSIKFTGIFEGKRVRVYFMIEYGKPVLYIYLVEGNDPFNATNLIVRSRRYKNKLYLYKPRKANYGNIVTWSDHECKRFALGIIDEFAKSSVLATQLRTMVMV